MKGPGTKKQETNILIWLPSPMGDAILCTPALRAIRRHFKSSKIWFYANPVVRETLSPCTLNDQWLEQRVKNPLAIAKELKKHRFTHAILFKNSFASALAVFLAGIQARIGYARENRGFLLTHKLLPARLPNGKFKPLSAVDYYLAIAQELGADVSDRSLELSVAPAAKDVIRTKLPELAGAKGPIVVIVPGGAFGPSKCWPNVRFAKTADRLIANYNATVIVSVAPNSTERQIAGEICRLSKHNPINLGERPLSIDELKALFSASDLVIANDTGPRHIAIAMKRKIVTIFGPNNPAWTETGYENEIQVIGNVRCAPCDKPICKKSEHPCMEAVTVEMVCAAAQELLEGNRKKARIYARRKFIEILDSFFLDPDYSTAFSKSGLTSFDAVFSFDAAKNLTKKNLANYRSRLQFEVNSHSATLFLKRYERPPVSVQIKNRLHSHRRQSCGFIEVEHINELAEAGIKTPKVVSYGQQLGLFFEKRSFIVTEKIPKAESLERRLPGCFTDAETTENLKQRREFITNLADFIKRFHETGYRHRDLYFSHIFYSDNRDFYLIDLARAFKPFILSRRFRIKDLAQLYYSASTSFFSNTDRLRFYLCYTGRKKLASGDDKLIRKILKKANRMVKHDMKHNRSVPFMSRRD
jgi:heptosyltransferase-2